MLQRQVAHPLGLLDPGQGEQIVDDRSQPVRLPADDLEESTPIGRVVDPPFEERLHEPLDRGDGGLQFMGDVGDKVAADVLEVADVGDVVEHDHGAPFP